MIMPPNSISSFPVMLINSGKQIWIPFHLWDDAFINCYRASRVNSTGSLYDVPAYYKERYHPKPDYKGKWIFTKDEKEVPLMWGELHRFNFGFQYDLLFFEKIAQFSGEEEALSLLISGTILSSGSDILRVFPASPASSYFIKSLVERKCGDVKKVSYLSRKVVALSKKRVLSLVEIEGIEILSCDWWDTTPGKKYKKELSYIGISRSSLDQKEADRNKKPTKTSRRGVLSRLFFPRSK